MNKKLIALAVAGACIAPAAMAQTANPVTLYGRVYLTLESAEATGGSAAAVQRRMRMIDQASFLGVRGTEDLGGGLKAIFQLETAFAPDDTSVVTITQAAVAAGAASAAVTSRVSTGWASRNSYIGLQGSFGSVLMGRHDTPMKSVITAVDPFGDLTPGDITGANLDQGNFSRRQDNSIQWWSPSWGGLQIRGLVTTNEGKSATADPKAFGASIAYSSGNLYLAYAYEKHEDGIAAQVGATTAGFEEDGNTVAARFTMGKLKISGSYGEYKKTGQAKDKSYMVGLEYGMGKNVFIGTYQNAEQGSADCDMYSVGYRYDFTRRTFFIASYTEVKNSDSPAMNCNFGTAGLGAAGQDPKSLAVGLRHVF